MAMTVGLRCHQTDWPKVQTFAEWMETYGNGTLPYKTDWG